MFWYSNNKFTTKTALFTNNSGNTFVSNDYEFEQPLRKRTIEIPASRLIDVSFDYPRQPQAGEEGIEAGEANAQAQNIAFDPEVSFFTQAADNDYFIDKQGYSSRILR